MTLRSYRQSNKSFSHTTQHLGLNRHTRRSLLNDQPSCPLSGHNILTAMSKVCLFVLLYRCTGYEEIDNLRPFILGRARIHLSIERWRVCETWFAPSMAGVDSAGLGEVLQNVLASFSTDDRGLLVQVRYSTLSSSPPSLPSDAYLPSPSTPCQNVFLTGTPARMPGLSDRLRATLRPILPPEMPLQIVRATDPSLDAWRGMAAFAQTEEFSRVGVTKAEYEEWGGERLRRWWGGNWNASVV